MVTMCRQLADLLGVNRQLLAYDVRRLEQAAGQPGADVRMTAEINAKTTRKIRELGLDPRDTNAIELYHALYNLAHLHDTFLAKAIGGNDPGDVAHMTEQFLHTMQRLPIHKDVWVLKHSVAKRMLKATPPKKLMRELGYRSIDSMIKREPVAELFAALPFAEDEAWLKQFTAKYQRLRPSDFETRKVEILRPTTPRWHKLVQSAVRHNRQNIAVSRELGAIIILPLPVKRLEGYTLIMLPRLLHSVHELRIFSAALKLAQGQAAFGRDLVALLRDDPGHHAVMAGQQVHWKVIARHYGRLELRYHPEVFDPYLTAEDLRFYEPSEVLYRLEPALHFWHGMEFAGIILNGQTISFNLLDMAGNLVNRRQVGYQLTYHMRVALRQELLSRYLQHPALESQVLAQLDTSRQTAADEAAIAREVFA